MYSIEMTDGTQNDARLTLDDLLDWVNGRLDPEREKAVRTDIRSPDSRVLTVLEGYDEIVSRIIEKEPVAFRRWEETHPFERMTPDHRFSDAQRAALESVGPAIDEHLRRFDAADAEKVRHQQGQKARRLRSDDEKGRS